MMKPYQCPYEKACKCHMLDECNGCETWAENKGEMYLEQENNKLRNALELIIKMNYQTAKDQYGDKSKADNWSCVTTAKQALGIK